MSRGRVHPGMREWRPHRVHARNSVLMDLRVALVVPRTEAEGPGLRFAAWVQGCTIRCAGCCNPEMFPSSGGTLIAPEELAERAATTPDVEGISILGGEPFEQAPACARFAKGARAAGLSVMVFTGYTLAELEAQRARESGVDELLAVTDLLVDGRFERDNPERERRWIGSTNQTMHFLSSRYCSDDPRFFAANTAEIRLERGVLTMNGWPALVPALRRTR
jgi:anaerobic ribonucleoside-triphosphate reductase activating protein